MLKKNFRFPARLKSAALAGAGAGAPRRTRRRLFSCAPSSRWHAAGVAALVLALHAAVLYAIARTAPTSSPQLSVPLTVSFATAAEPLRAIPKNAPPKPKSPPVKPRTAAPAPQPAPITQPDPAPVQDMAPAPDTARTDAPAPPSVSMPRFDAAYLNNPAPAYPPLSRRLGEEGRVLLRVFVDSGGRAREVRIQSASGYARLDRAAQEAVARWRFVPARRGEDAVGAWVLVPISFTLKQG